MNNFLDAVKTVNASVYDFVWGMPGLILLISVGVLLTVGTKAFQVARIGHWWKNTIATVFKKNSRTTDKGDGKTISQFQSLCTALAATIGTGNIAGVSTAIVTGGPGAVFWMWFAAFFGMMTKFSETVLGIYYRRRNSDGEWSGGAMYYLTDGLGKRYNKKILSPVSKVLAVLFAVFTILASFGIGNMSQVNAIVKNINNAFFSNVSLGTVAGVDVISLIVGIVIMAVSSLIIFGGIQRIARVAEIIVPIMAIAYIVGALVIFGINIDKVGDMFAAIFKFAFTPSAVIGGGIGVTVKAVIKGTVTQGFKRGMFSNEAGLGSSVMAHASSNVKEPVKQGMWGIFEVFFDTFVVCTMTAIVVLSSGIIDLTTGSIALGKDVEGVEGVTLVAEAFGKYFGSFGTVFMAIAILFFAFTTVLGWSQYGVKAVEYLGGKKAIKIYKTAFALMIAVGAVMKSQLAWDVSDTFNGLMMIPNLIGVVALSPLVFKITDNYIERNIKKNDVKPMLSYDPKIQKELESELNKN